MFTLALIALATSGWLTVFRLQAKNNQLRYARAVLPSADTDEDVLGVLEASEAGIATRLLEAASKLAAGEPWRHTRGSVEMPPEVRWKLMVADIELETDERLRLEVLTEWLARGVRLTDYEAAELPKLFKDPLLRISARELITDATDATQE